MRLTSILMALTGLAVAGGSAFAARDYIEAQSAPQNAGEEMPVVQVVAAARDIAFGQPIEAHMLTSIAWPREAVPPGTFTNYEVLVSGPGGEPRRARRSIAQGELILASKVSNFGEKVTIVQTLRPGHRAMAITVNAATGVGGFVTPGDAVDVLLTHGNGDTLSTATILQNIRIIGVDQDANEDTDRPGIARTVTAEVTPGDGQKLALAQQAGTLSLTLRTVPVEGEAPTAPLDSVRLADVLGTVTPPPAPAPEPEPAAIEVAAPAPAPAPAPRREIVVRRGNVASVDVLN